MGKMLSGMIAVIFMAGGLTALTIEGASAACPYGGCVDSTCHANNLNNPRVGHPAKVRFRVLTGGNGRARGVVTFRYVRRGNGVVKGIYHRRYRGYAKEIYKFRGLPRGKYVVRVRFDSRPQKSVYTNDRTSFRQNVRPRR